MSAGVIFAPRARRELRDLDVNTRERVLRAVRRYAESQEGDVVRLQGQQPPEWRLRVGDYRIRFHHAGDKIEVVRVAHRRDVYRER